MSDYPGALDSFTDGVAGQPLNNPSLVERVNELNAALLAVQTALGINPQGVATDVAARMFDGLGFRELLTFTSSDTFVKADYPWLRAVRARVVGGGGSGGGCSSTGAGENSFGNGGGGGGYAESLLTVNELASSETITVGSGGIGVSGPGSAGGSSSFGTHAVATGGSGGATRQSTATVQATGSDSPGGQGTSGQIRGRGTPGQRGHNLTAGGSASTLVPGEGGGSVLSPGGGTPVSGVDAPSTLPGTGGSGRAGAPSTGNIRGGHGTKGIVILELYG